jgi:hypothetical protein
VKGISVKYIVRRGFQREPVPSKRKVLPIPQLSLFKVIVEVPDFFRRSPMDVGMLTQVVV